MFKQAICLASFVAMFSTAASTALAQSSGPDWRFQLGFSYNSGVSKLMDEFEIEGYETEWEWPVGTTFLVGQDFSNGLGWDASVGPMIFVFGDVDAYVIPVGVGGRYTFTPANNIAPFVRAGVSYAFAGGDFIDSGDVGFTGAVGVEFNRESRMSYGFEVAYNSVSVEFNHSWWHADEDVKTNEWQVGAFIAF